MHGCAKERKNYFYLKPAAIFVARSRRLASIAAISEFAVAIVA